MKNSILIAGMILLAASCSNDECGNFVENNGGYTPVTVSVSGFSVEQGAFPGTGGMTRAMAVGSYSGVSFLTLAFYASNGTELYKHTQEKGNLEQGETFGEFSTTLPIGSYTMVVLGYVLYDDDALTLTSPTLAEYTVNAPRETFAATQVLNVTSTAALNLTATLDRIIACLQVISTDGRTENANKVRMTFAAGGKQFSPTTGLATANTGSVSTVSNNFTVGTSSTSTGYVFLTSDTQTMDVTIETLDAQGNTIFSKTVENVPFQRNRKTKLTGAIYSASAAAGSFQVNTEWLADYSDTF